MTSAAQLGGQPRIHQIFDRRLAASPDSPFLLMVGASLSLRDLDAMVVTLSTEMVNSGVVPGDRVLVIAENCPEHVALILACSRIGAWSCGINARMSQGEIAGFVAKSDPRMVYYTGGVSAAAMAHADRNGAQPSDLNGLQCSAARAQAVAEEGELAARIAAIIFTSGTTGAPKGVLVSHAGLMHFARVSAESRSLGPDDRSYACLPMTHIFGLATVLMASLHAGSALVMRSRFDPAELLDALAHEAVTMLQGPPALFSRLLAWAEEQRLDRPVCPNLRYVYTGAAPLDLALKRAVEAHFSLPLHHGYGLSEYAGALCLVEPGVQRDDTSAGYLVEGAELRIVDGQGVDLVAPDPGQPGGRGEIWMRGTGLMPGYFRDHEATAQVMRPGGWYASGDIGYQAADGALFVVGRLKEMIIRSGFNVYPVEVEAVLVRFAGIQRAAVVGRREADGNEEVLAFVETVSGATLDLAALNLFLAGHLAPYKRPSRVITVQALPMTHSGKILKRALLELPLPLGD